VTFNSEGQASSLWASVRTGQASPAGVPAPTVMNITSCCLTLQVGDILKPNGVIINYNVFTNFTLVLKSPSAHIYITNLRPSTVYVVYVEACTVAGCTEGPAVTMTTISDLPQDLDPPTVSNITATSMNLSWTDPRIPNGRITRFHLLWRSVCPYPYADTSDKVSIPCVVGLYTDVVLTGLVYTAYVDRLKPYTKYEYQLSVDNEAGTIDQPVTTYATTLPAAPSYRPDSPLQLQLSGSTATLDWTTSFDINAEVKDFILFLNSTALYIGPDTSFTYNLQSQINVYLFYVELTTDYGKASTPVMIFDPTQSQYFVVYTTLPVTMTTQALMTSPQPSMTSFYEEVWFIALCCVVGFFLLVCFIMILFKFCCCQRSTTYIRQRIPGDVSAKEIPASSAAGFSNIDDDEFEIRQTPLGGYFLEDDDDPYQPPSGFYYKDGYKKQQLNEYGPRHRAGSCVSDLSEPYIADARLGFVNPYLASSPQSTPSRSLVSLAEFRDKDSDVKWHRDSGLNSLVFDDDYETSTYGRRPRTVLDDVISNL
jgi:usherin